MFNALIRTGGALRAMLRCSLVGLTASAGMACAAAQTTPTHALAMHGEPALPAGFTHFPHADPLARKGGGLHIGFQGTFDSLNPFNVLSGSAAQGLQGNVFQPLMARNPDEPFTLYGLVAKSVETNEARSFVTFHLDPLAQFSNGEKITPDDVLFTFNLLKARGRPQYRLAFSLVRSAIKADESSVRFDLAGAEDRELPLILALMPVLSRSGIDVKSFDSADLAFRLGSGPYVIGDVDPGRSLVLKRNPLYWARDLPSQRGQFNFDEIHIEYFRDGAAMFEAFKAGTLDYREENNPSRWQTGYQFPGVRAGRAHVETAPLGGPKGMEGLAFNTRRPLFADVRMREALAMMFDFEWLNANIYGGLYQRTKSYFDDSELASIGAPASPEERALLAPWPGAVRDDILEGRWRPPVSDGSGRDRNLSRRALALLRQAGYAISDGKLRNLASGAPLRFEIMVADRTQERLASYFSSGLSRIGVEARVRMVDEVQFQRRRQKFDFDMMPGQWAASASPGNEQRSRWGSASAGEESAYNLAGARSQAIDALIGEILAARSREAFSTAVRAYDRVLLSGFYIVPLYHTGEQRFAWREGLARPLRNARYAVPLWGATLDTWWRSRP